MNLTAGSRPQHLEDGDLIAYMDHQMDRSRSRWAAGHLEGCAECAARMNAMQGRAGALSAWLEAADEPVADERRALAMAAVERARFRSRASRGWMSRSSLAVAAMIAMMLTVAFGTPPGRAWVGSAAERLGLGDPGERPTESVPSMGATPGQPAAAPVADNVVGVEDETAAPTAAGRSARRPGLPPGMSAPVRFNPSGNYVLLQVDSRQRVGVVTLWVQNTTNAEGQIVAGRTGETLEPLADGLRLRNTGGSRADYTVTVPTRYRYIRLKIGDEPETTIAVSRANRAWLWTVNLAASEGS